MLKPGSLMSGASDKTPPTFGEQDKNLHLQATLCLTCGQNSEAFLILSRLAENKAHPVLFFNLALCHFRAEVWVEAQKCLEKALAQLPPVPETPVSQNSTFSILAVEEAQSQAYGNPMQMELLTWPMLAKLRMLRLLIDIYALSGQWREVLQLAPALEPGNYKNVAAAMAKARAQQGA